MAAPLPLRTIPLPDPRIYPDLEVNNSPMAHYHPSKLFRRLSRAFKKANNTLEPTLDNCPPTWLLDEPSRRSHAAATIFPLTSKGSQLKIPLPNIEELEESSLMQSLPKPSRKPSQETVPNVEISSSHSSSIPSTMRSGSKECSWSKGDRSHESDKSDHLNSSSADPHSYEEVLEKELQKNPESQRTMTYIESKSLNNYPIKKCTLETSSKSLPLPIVSNTDCKPKIWIERDPYLQDKYDPTSSQSTPKQTGQEWLNNNPFLNHTLEGSLHSSPTSKRSSTEFTWNKVEPLPKYYPENTFLHLTPPNLSQQNTKEWIKHELDQKYSTKTTPNPPFSRQNGDGGIWLQQEGELKYIPEYSPFSSPSTFSKQSSSEYVWIRRDPKFASEGSPRSITPPNVSEQNSKEGIWIKSEHVQKYIPENSIAIPYTPPKLCLECDNEYILAKRIQKYAPDSRTLYSPKIYKPRSNEYVLIRNDCIRNCTPRSDLCMTPSVSTQTSKECVWIDKDTKEKNILEEAVKLSGQVCSEKTSKESHQKTGDVVLEDVKLKCDVCAANSQQEDITSSSHHQDCINPRIKINVKPYFHGEVEKTEDSQGEERRQKSAVPKLMMEIEVISEQPSLSSEIIAPEESQEPSATVLTTANQHVTGLASHGMDAPPSPKQSTETPPNSEWSYEKNIHKINFAPSLSGKEDAPKIYVSVGIQISATGQPVSAAADHHEETPDSNPVTKKLDKKHLSSGEGDVSSTEKVDAIDDQADPIKEALEEKKTAEETTSDTDSSTEEYDGEESMLSSSDMSVNCDSRNHAKEVQATPSSPPSKNPQLPVKDYRNSSGTASKTPTRAVPSSQKTFSKGPGDSKMVKPKVVASKLQKPSQKPIKKPPVTKNVTPNKIIAGKNVKATPKIASR